MIKTRCLFIFLKFVVGSRKKIKYIPVSVKAMKKASPICKQPPQDMSIIFTPFKVETMAGMFSVDLCQKQYLNPLTSENYNKKSQKCSSCFDVKKRVKFLQVGVTFEGY